MNKKISPLLLPCWVILLSVLLFLAKTGFPRQSEKVFAGADEKTPSRSEYFTWVNNNGEGSTEKQTLINLDFFRWLHDEYGMVLDIYAFDAGNVDNGEYSGSARVSKFKTQFPRGYGPLADKAAEMGTRLGIWDAPDKFGATPEEERKRIDQMVSLCRDFHFALFKFDAMGGDLRNEKQGAFIRMMTACRAYCPDLVLLNHRINLGPEAASHATTWLLGGDETYVDVHMANTQTATHHRAGTLSRELTPDLHRLVEDHGVCLSSCLDYWEDDLILQAFNRALVLAPQIYGSPWLLRDEEFPRLARIFNLARKYGTILVNGILLPEKKYGDKAVSRGDGQTRLLTLRNLGWEPVTRAVTLDGEIGLTEGSTVELRQVHPVERVIGRFKKGQTVDVVVLPFRSCLLLATAATAQDPSIEGCDYEVVRDVAGKPLKINVFAFPGERKKISLRRAGRVFNGARLDGRPLNELLTGAPVEIAFAGSPLGKPYHRKLGDLVPASVPGDAESLYEATCFAADNNALEVRSLLRSGPTKISQVQKARDAFLGQDLFISHGLWDRYLFDGNRKTSFYVDRRQARVDPRVNGGALRLDLGEAARLDRLTIFVEDDQALQPFQRGGDMGAEVSPDLKNWEPVPLLADTEMTLALDPEKPIRYLRFPATPEKVSEIEGYLKDVPADRSRWRASNLFSPYSRVKPKAAFSCRFVLDDIPAGSYLAIALNGLHGKEGAYAALRINGAPFGATDRSVSFPCNSWNYQTIGSDSNYTYYFPLTPAMKNAAVEAVVLVAKNGSANFKPEAWITAYPIPYQKKELILN